MFQSVFVIVVALKTLADGLSIFNQGTKSEKISVEEFLSLRWIKIDGWDTRLCQKECCWLESFIFETTKTTES